MHRENKTKSGAYLNYYRNKIIDLKNSYLLKEIKQKNFFYKKKCAIIQLEEDQKGLKIRILLIYGVNQ